jgi:hypothetical protein
MSDYKKAALKKLKSGLSFADGKSSQDAVEVLDVEGEDARGHTAKTKVPKLDDGGNSTGSGGAGKKRPEIVDKAYEHVRVRDSEPDGEKRTAGVDMEAMRGVIRKWEDGEIDDDGKPRKKPSTLKSILDSLR